MAIIDKLLTVSDQQAVTATAVSTDSIDLLTSRDVGMGEQLFMLFTVQEAAAAAGAATVAFSVVIDDASALSSARTIATSEAIGMADLVVGAQVAVPIPPTLGDDGERYLGASYTVATGPLTAGKFHATVVRSVSDSVKFYPTNITIS